MNDNLNMQNTQQPEMQPQPMETLYAPNVNQQVGQPVNPYQTFNTGMDLERNTSNKKHLGILIPIIVLVIALVGAGAYYFISSSNPLKTYQGIIKTAISGVYDMVEVDDKFSTSLSLDVNLDLEEDMLDKEILDLINDAKINIGVQYDRKNELAVAKVDSSIGKDSLLKANMYLNNKDEKLYVYAKELLDKYIEIENEDFSVFDVLFEELTKEQKSNIDKSQKILIKELVKVITKEDVYTEKGYHVLKISGEKLGERLENVIENLKNNKEFLSCFEDEYTVTSLLDSITISYSDDTEIKYMIKKSLFNKIEEAIVEIEEMKAVIKIDGEKVSYEIVSSGEKVLDGHVDIKEDKETTDVKLVMNIPELGALAINTSTTYVTKFDMDSVNNSKVVSMDELTEDEQEELMGNLENSLLYELISSFMPSDDFEDDYNSPITDTENAVTLYGSGARVAYSVPYGYELGYASESFKRYDKGDISVTIIANYGETENEYLITLNDKPSYYKDDYYQNVLLSGKSSLNVGDRLYYYRDFTYEYKGYNDVTKYYNKYLYTRINDEDSIVIEVESTGTEISESDLNTFLTLSY